MIMIYVLIRSPLNTKDIHAHNDSHLRHGVIATCSNHLSIRFSQRITTTSTHSAHRQISRGCREKTDRFVTRLTSSRCNVRRAFRQQGARATAHERRPHVIAMDQMISTASSGPDATDLGLQSKMIASDQSLKRALITTNRSAG